MENGGIPLKVRTDLKNNLDQIIRGGTAIKRAVHRFAVTEITHPQWDTLVRLVFETQVLMNSLKPQPAKEDYVQQILDFAMTLPEKEDSTQEDDNPEVVLDLKPTVNGEVHS